MSTFARTGERTYENALEILDSRRRPARPDAAIPRSSPERQPGVKRQQHEQLRGSPSIAGMQNWLLRIGHKLEDIDKLNVIHVAGTKGKGSTCAFTESFLRAYGNRTGFPSKTGLYTSPHLIFPEERIRIGFNPISRELFTKYFFEVWTSLSQNSDQGPMPRYLQLLALTALHAFVQEKVEATIVETHHGGEYDATNFLNAPLVTMITTLGMDHVEQLGPTIEDIAWHKAGIFKKGARAFSTSQDHAAAEVLRRRASEKGISLEFAESDSSLPADALQLTPDVQRLNCSLALAGARAYVQAKSKDQNFHLLPEDIELGVKQFTWPGRFQTITDGDIRWNLDGAHNELSAVKVADWYTGLVNQDPQTKRVLIFGHVSLERDAMQLLRKLADSLSRTRIDHVIFIHYDPHQSFHNIKDTTPKEPEMAALHEFAAIWKGVNSSGQVTIKRNIDEAIDTARTIAAENNGIQALITGSQHLVGAALFCMNYREL